VNVPRLTSETFPPYSYVPGRFPHPHADAGGHGFGHPAAPIGRVEPAQWRDCAPYLLGLDLFNHGYYWEAHEAWETAWNGAGRRGVTAAFLKALIQLAVAGVKVRQEMPMSAGAHARRAAELLRDVQRDAAQSCYMGLEIEPLAHAAEKFAEMPPSIGTARHDVEVLFSFVLVPVTPVPESPSPCSERSGSVDRGP
jgi:uncharacterized protein